MSDPAHPAVHVLFHVPEGLEFVALEEIKARLQMIDEGNNNGAASFLEETGTGRVHVIVPHAWDLRGMVRGLQTSPLRSVYSIMLVASKTTLSQTAFADPDQTVAVLANQTETCDWGPVIEAASCSSYPTGIATSSPPPPPTFRGTFLKGQLKHPVRSQTLAGHVGFAFSKRFPTWKVQLEQYDYEVVGLWMDDARFLEEGHHEGDITLLVGLSVQQLPDTKYRNRVFFGRTSLNPPIAYCLARLANPRAGDIVLDMCCGTGTIPIEGGAAFPDTLWLGSEVKVKTLCQKAQGNVDHAQLKNVNLFLGDGRKMCLRDGCVDMVVSDWPWGMREGSYSTIQKLYPKFIRQISNVLRPKGKAYIVTQGRKLLDRVLSYPWCKEMWDVDRIVTVGIGGYKVYLYMMTRK
ncbi:putative RNA methylase family UPF0020-domain-containing protein [Dichotomocladium elegans]|nr:putative RNA methylase family UPF0020-domain-containing protein [Dichotomocladium elegans]